tara:strand:- start:341 stop:736 length:396 start_codon:yes stop_codon:yes gene_type:complete
MNILNEVIRGASRQFGREFGRAGANAILKGKNYYTVNHSNDKLYVYFEVQTNYGELRKFERTFFDFGKEECNKINTLVYFTNRYTTNEEFDWLKKLVASEIEYINVKVKKQYSDNKYIYREKIFSKNLSSN